MMIVVLVVKSRDMNTTTPRSARRKGTTEPELLFTWEVLHSINATHTFHIEDNPAYHDIVITRNMIAQVRTSCESTRF